MLARVHSAAVLGIDAYLVEVEADIAPGLPSFSTVGLPQGAVREGRERVTAALVNAGFDFPLRRITINLAPADVPKQGSAFDLPVAVGILVASAQLPPDGLAKTMVLGEVGLEGDLRPVRGALSMALAARDAGFERLVLPEENAREAGVVDDLRVYGADSLSAVCGFLAGEKTLTQSSVDVAALLSAPGADGVDFSDVRSQASAKRALEVAAAGGHNILVLCPKGGHRRTGRTRPLSTTSA